MQTKDYTNAGNYYPLSLNPLGGNIGIGNTAPGCRLDVSGTIHASSVLEVGSVSNSGTAVFMENTDYNQHRATDSTVAIGSFSIAPSYGLDLFTNNTLRMRITREGNIGIGINAPTDKLSVNGNVRAKKVSVTQSSWPDYVFEPDYILPSLSTLNNFIKLNKRLPEVPSAKEVQEKGVDLGATQALLLKKIEELTLHLIALDQKNAKLEAQNKGLEERLRKLEKR